MRELEKTLEEVNRQINEYVDHDYVRGSGDVVKGLSIAKSIIRKHMNDGWIPVEERLPENNRSVLMCGDTGCIDVGWWNGKRWKTGFSHADNFEAVAWRPLPEPYRPERRIQNNDVLR